MLEIGDIVRCFSMFSPDEFWLATVDRVDREACKIIWMDKEWSPGDGYVQNHHLTLHCHCVE